MANRVAVIIPTYNRSKLLERAIESVIKQTYRPIELIVINNASTDNTDEIIDKFKAKKDNDIELVYLTQLKNDRNAARNLGIVKATGEFICFLDDDDEFMPEKLKKQAAFLSKDRSVDIVFSNSLLETEGHTRPFFPSLASHNLKHHTQKEVIQMLCDGNFIPITNVMIRASVIKNNLFNFSLNTHEDYELWLRLAPKHRFDWIDEPLSLVHSHKHEQRYDMRQVRIDQIEVILKHIDNYTQHFEMLFNKIIRLRNILITKHNELEYIKKLNKILFIKLGNYKDKENSSIKGLARIFSAIKIRRMEKALIRK
jgi:glycosyltransferase involved in cell wall biosynthesis